MNYTELTVEIKDAMLNKNNIKKNELKQVLAKAQNLAKLEKREVTEEDIVTALNQELKQLEQTRGMIPKESDLYKETEEAVNLLTAYLPAQMSDEECEEKVREFVGTLADKSQKGRVIGLVIKEFKGLVSNERLKAIVEKILA
jgi:uncharacterized protein